MQDSTIAVIAFPGSNCERETALAIERSGMRAHHYYYNCGEDLAQFDAYVIVGGFSYEDRGRAGLIAAKNSLLEALEREAEKGKPILGICNGAQILLESGLLLGDKSQRHRVALAQNRRLRDGEVLGTGYYNDWVWIKKHQAANSEGAFVNAVPGPICVPVAHGEGRFLIDEELYQSLQAQGAPMWQYCQEDGALDEHFPCNPNGSMYNLAALSNASGTICAMMPHPERTENGDSVFKSMARYIAQKKKQSRASSMPAPAAIAPLKQAKLKAEPGHLLVALNIVDNHAVSLQMALAQMGLEVSVGHYRYWQIKADDWTKDLCQKLIDSGEIIQTNKERLLAVENVDFDLAYRVGDLDNTLGEYTLARVHHRFGLKQVQSIDASALWTIKVHSGQVAKVRDLIEQESFFYHPKAHRVMRMVPL